MTSLFDKTINATDRHFVILRDDPDSIRYRQFVEKLWQLYEPYADKHFATEIACQFHPRFWEMYLACVLMAQGQKLVPHKIGPDICISKEGCRLWVEAIAPGPGEGPDALEEPEIPPNGRAVAFGIPEREIVLRLCSAIEEKRQKYLEYVRDGIVKNTDLFIIAVNGGMVPLSSFESGIPNILKAVLPFGDWTVTFDRQSSQVVKQGYAYRPEITKKKGAPVSTCTFLEEENSGISAVLYSNVTVWKAADLRGDDFVLIRNPKASNPLQYGWITVGTEYWVEGEAVKKKCWSEGACIS